MSDRIHQPDNAPEADILTHEAFARVVAETVRNCLLAAAGSPEPARWNARSHLKEIVSMPPDVETINWTKLVDLVVECLRDPVPQRRFEDPVTRAARRGTLLFLEMSSSDEFTRSRASRRVSSFLRAIRDVEDAHRAGRSRARRRHPTGEGEGDGRRD